MNSRKLQLPFAITIATKKCQLLTHIKRKAKKIINYTMTILRRQLIMNKPYIKDQYKPNQETIKETERAFPIYTLFHR